MSPEYVEAKRILVTGGAGFLGSNPCDRLLAQGHEVVCLIQIKVARVFNTYGPRMHPNVRLPLPQDDPRQRQPDTMLARATLDWEPKAGLEAGLRRTIDHFDKLLRKRPRRAVDLHVPTLPSAAQQGVRAVGQ